MAPTARESTTLILTRERMPQGLEVFLVRRSLTSAFMADNYVCPGGAVDGNDRDPAILSVLKGAGEGPMNRELLPFMVAGLRELFEEAGVLPAMLRSGGHLTLEEPGVRARFSEYRGFIARRAMDLKSLAGKEGLILSVEGLRHFAHWITPEARPIRFDTHFFICPAPPGQEASADEKETTAGVWLSPEEALTENLAGRIALSPPTLATLEEMVPFRSLEALLAMAGSKAVQAVMPVFVDLGEEHLVVFPWDADFQGLAAGDIPFPLDHGSLSRTGEATTRLLVSKGRNIPYRKK
jgi:8-oxo-dGTP pyrophosphatase MutT (NUDIX family)